MNTPLKWVAGAVGVPVVAVALYLAFVIQLYVLAYVLKLIGVIFT